MRLPNPFRVWPGDDTATAATSHPVPPEAAATAFALGISLRPGPYRCRSQTDPARVAACAAMYPAPEAEQWPNIGGEAGEPACW